MVTGSGGVTPSGIVPTANADCHMADVVGNVAAIATSFASRTNGSGNGNSCSAPVNERNDRDECDDDDTWDEATERWPIITPPPPPLSGP